MKTLTRLSAAALLVLAPIGVAAAQTNNQQNSAGGVGGDVKERINPQGASGQEAITNSGGPGAGQGKRRTNTMPDRHASESNKPPLQLSEQQRGAIVKAVADEDTHQKTPANYQPKVGEPITSAIKPHPLPRPLINNEDVLKQYTYVKLDHNIVLIDPMSMKVVEIIPHQSPSATNLPKTPVQWAATRGRELLGLPPEEGDSAKAGTATGTGSAAAPANAVKDAAAAAKEAAAAAEKAAAAAKEAAAAAEKAAAANLPAGPNQQAAPRQATPSTAAANQPAPAAKPETTGQPPADDTATQAEPSGQPPATGDTPPAGGEADTGTRQ